MEKRKYKRKIVKNEVDGKMILIDHIHILNLSMNGIHFKCDRSVNMNCVHKIKLEKNGISVAVTGQVVRETLTLDQRTGSTVPVYEVAMTFKNLPEEKKKSLEKLISLIRE